MTDEQLDRRFAAIVQALEALLAVAEKHSDQISQLAAVTAQHSEEILRISREWEAYFRTIRPQ